MMTEKYENSMTDRDKIGYHGHASGLSDFVSVVKFCGKPILPPVVSLHLPFCCNVLYFIVVYCIVLSQSSYCIGLFIKTFKTVFNV